MNTKLIRNLAQIMKESSLSVLEVTEGETKIRLEKNNITAEGIKAVLPPTSPCLQDTAVKTLSPMMERAVDFNRITEVKSPMVGVFYAAPAVGAEPFVKVGSKVKKGDVLCIIEAMKVLNEILAETDGEIVDICVVNGQVVEFSQILFKIF